MATNEVPGFLKYKDADGNINLLLPITTKDNVDGLDEMEAALNETVKFTAQTLTDEQKAQVRTNIGAGTSNVTSYLDLTSKPTDTVVGSDTLTWDGNTEGLEYIDPTGEGVMILYQLSDETPVAEDFPNGCKFEVYMQKDSINSLYDTIQYDNVTVQSFFSDDGFGVFENEGIYIIPYDDYTLESVVFPKKGIYSMVVYSPTATMYLGKFTIPGYTGFTKEILKSEALPEHTHAWDNIDDRPFGDLPTGGDTLTWDGNIEGLLFLDLSGDGSAGVVKVSNAVVTKEDVVNGYSASVTANGSTSEVTVEGTKAQSLFQEDGYGILADLFHVFPCDNYDYQGTTMPEAGIYALYMGGNESHGTVTIPGYTGFPGVKKLDEKYLPDTVATISDIESAIGSAIAASY